MDLSNMTEKSNLNVVNDYDCVNLEVSSVSSRHSRNVENTSSQELPG